MFTLLYLVEIVVLCTVFVAISFIALVVCYPFDRSRRVVHELSRLMVKIFLISPPLWRRKVDGLENIEKGKSYVIIINHNTMVDIPALYLLPINFRWVSKREVYWTPFFGQFLWLHGDICIRRGHGSEAMAQLKREGKQWLESGASVAIFPEGTRSKSGEIGRFKVGAFSLAQENGVEILPVVMTGTRSVFGKNNRINWRNTLSIRVMKPVKMPGIGSEVDREVIDSVRAQMVEELRGMRSEL